MSAWQIDIMTEALFITLHFLLFLASYYLLGKKISQPATLFSLIWFLITAAHLLYKLTLLNNMNTPSADTYIIFLAGNISFTGGSFLVNQHYAPKLEQVTSPPPQLPVNANLRTGLTIFLLISLPFFIKKAVEIFIASQLEEFFMGLKYEISYGEANFGIFIYLLQLSYVVLAINLHAWYKEKSKRNLAVLICSVACTLAYAIFASGRLHLFMVLCIYVGITFFSGQKISLKKIAMPALIFFILFFVAGIIYKKGGDIDNSFDENLRAGTESLGLYIVIPLDGLDYDLTKHVSENTEGERTLRFFVKLAHETGISKSKPKNLLQEFVLTPYPTNVYTFYSSYILDFGKLYAWLMLFIYGMLHTFLYNMALLKRRLNIVLYYSFLLFPLMLTFFDDLYMTVFSFWLQIVFFTEVILFADKIVKAKQKNQYH